METKEYTELKERIDQFYRDLDKRLQKIEDALLGDSFGHRGLVKRIEETEKRVDNIENKLWKLIAVILGAAAGTVGLTEVLFRMIGF